MILYSVLHNSILHSVWPAYNMHEIVNNRFINIAPELVTMSNQFKGSIGRTWQDSKPWWPQPIKAPVDAPNIAYIILDDVGYCWLGCYGGPTDTPNIDKLAANGLLSNNRYCSK
jgi:hypothetical protein